MGAVADIRCSDSIGAAVDAFALKLICNDRVRVYDTSLMEWSADDAFPMTDTSAVDAVDLN